LTRRWRHGSLDAILDALTVMVLVMIAPVVVLRAFDALLLAFMALVGTVRSRLCEDKYTCWPLSWTMTGSLTRGTFQQKRRSGPGA
jgi:hypothetical protein